MNDMLNVAEGIRRRIGEDGSVHVLQRHLSEHRHSPEHIVQLYRAFASFPGGCDAEACRVFCDSLAHSRQHECLAEALLQWSSLLGARYCLEECMGFLEYFNRACQNVPMKDGEMYGRMLETLLGVGWVLNRHGALFELSVVCERVCEMITAVGKPSAKSTAISYLELLSEVFIESNMLFSYVNTVNTLVLLDCSTIARQCSLDDLRLLCSYVGVKNEEDRHRKLFCKIRFSAPEEIVANAEKRCSEVEIKNSLVRRRFDFEMWKRYVDGVGKSLPVAENIDLVAFMRKNDFGFSVADGVVVPGAFEYRSVERKIFEIVDEYREKHVAAAKPVPVQRIRTQDVAAARAEEPVAKKTVRFVDRFSVPYKRMECYSRYFRENAEGIEDAWYEERNNRAQEEFERSERMHRQSRDELKVYRDVVEEMRRDLVKRIEECRKTEECVRPKTTRTHWRDEAEGEDTPRVYRLPVQDQRPIPYRPPRYVPPQASPNSAGDMQRSRASRNNSWFADPEKKE